MIPDPPEGGTGVRRPQDDADDGSAAAHGIPPADQPRVHAGAGRSAARPASRRWRARSSTQVIERGECDFVADIAGEMPSYVIAELMGIPLDDGRKLYQLTETIHSAPEALPEGAQGAAVMEMFEYAQRVIAEKRARPADDLSSKLLAAEVDGRKLDDIDFQLFFLLLVDAGGDTTRNLVAAGLLALLEHPDELAKLRREPRHVAAVGARGAAALGQPGDLHAPHGPPRHRDRGSEDPQRRQGGALLRRCQLRRAPVRRSLSPRPESHARTSTSRSAPGAHVCLGQHIARVEIDAMLREVLTSYARHRTGAATGMAGV